MLGPNSYGKSAIRLVKVARKPDRHELQDLTVDVALEGDFEAAYTAGDNAGLVATDTVRNVVHAVAQELDFDDIEDLGRALVERLLEIGPRVTGVRTCIAQHPWERLDAHEHAFQGGAGGRRIAIVTNASVEAGIDDLTLLRTTGSGFEGYQRDRYTTLAETGDRILATSVAATWSYPDRAVDYGRVWRGARAALLRAFADHYSPSVQFTLHRMGRAVLDAHPEIERIRLSLPNRHHLPVDLSPFGLDSAIFHATTEPSGLIEGTVERSRP